MASGCATPIRYFTLPREDYDTITAWLQSKNLEYESFFASFIHFLRRMQYRRRLETTRDYTYKDSKIDVFEKKDAHGVCQPLQAQALIEEMKKYAQWSWADKLSRAPNAIDLKESRKGDRAEIEANQQDLAADMWPMEEEQKAMVCSHPHLRWLFPKAFLVPAPLTS